MDTWRSFAHGERNLLPEERKNQLRQEPIQAFGKVVVELISGGSNSKERDRRMHAKVLQSAFIPKRFSLPTGSPGKIAVPGAHGLNYTEPSGYTGLTMHTSTFRPILCRLRAGLATLDVLDAEDLGERALVMGEFLRGRLGGYEMVCDTRGMGMLSGIELHAPKRIRLGVAFEAFRHIHESMFHD